MGKRVKLGDVIQIPTRNGVHIAQVTHKNPQFGHLLRIFGTPIKDLSDIVDVLCNTPKFSAFFPLQHAINEGLFTVTGNYDVPDLLQPFPIFVDRVETPDGQFGPWWLWDGDKEWRLDGDLSPEEKKFPQREMISAPLLIERLENGYSDGDGR